MRAGAGTCALVAIALIATGGQAGANEPAVALERAHAPVCPVRDVHLEPGETRAISLSCAGLNRSRARIVKAPGRGRLGSIDQSAESVRYTAPSRASAETRLVVTRRSGGRVWRTAVRIEVGERGGPRCSDDRAISRYRGEARLRITCRGSGLERLRVVSGPYAGELSDVERSGGPSERTLTASYEPEPRFAGQDLVLVGASGDEGQATPAAAVPVLPWRMRALGDSVTAGFGFYEDGSQMTASEFIDCKPPAVVTNACSSNSDEVGDYTGAPEWSADFGLGNNVAWPAQFANGLQGGGKVTAPDMFQNRAVTGSAPSDWLAGGILNGDLDGIVAENPDLIALTLGANPLLSDVLASAAGEECADTDNATELDLCVGPYFEQQQVVERLEQIYETLLGAEDATILVLQYHLAVPSANLFDPWQLEVLTDYLNSQIEFAVDEIQASATPADAKRLVLIESQVEPTAPSPAMIPRFNIGLPPSEQNWTAGHDCGDGDLVDGQSHQSEPTQDEFQIGDPSSYCEGTEWIIGSDTGIHPNVAGHGQFAATLATVAQQNNLVPRLP